MFESTAGNNNVAVGNDMQAAYSATVIIQPLVQVL